MKTIEVRSAGITDTGKLRMDNQDHFLVVELSRGMKVLSGAGRFEAQARLAGAPKGHLFIVADGMGGHRGGSEASSFAVEYCANAILNNVSWMDKSEASNEDEFVEDLKLMLENAHRAVEVQSQNNLDCAGMGTTLTLAYVTWPRMIVVHAGDTRCYLLRKGKLQLVTRDHTVANEMMQKGQLAPEEMERSQWSNVLVNALGAGASSVTPDIYKLDLHRDDAILLCSDGLNKHVSDLQIKQTLNHVHNPQSACEMLVSMAKQGGGTDNITVVLAQFFAPQPQRNRLQLILSRPSEELLLQDLEMTASELDTQSMEADTQCSEGNDIDDGDGQANLKDTCDFT